jgi:hypothetical protein
MFSKFQIPAELCIKHFLMRRHIFASAIFNGSIIYSRLQEVLLFNQVLIFRHLSRFQFSLKMQKKLWQQLCASIAPSPQLFSWDKLKSGLLPVPHPHPAGTQDSDARVSGWRARLRGTF